MELAYDKVFSDEKNKRNKNVIIKEQATAPIICAKNCSLGLIPTFVHILELFKISPAKELATVTIHAIKNNIKVVSPTTYLSPEIFSPLTSLFKNDIKEIVTMALISIGFIPVFPVV